MLLPKLFYKLLMFTQSMEITGLRRTDTRLEEMMKFFKQLKKDRGFTHINAVEVGKRDFKQ